MNSELFDAAKVGRRILLRYWKPGDRFQPIGMPKRVKLQDFFTNLKIPRNERHKRLLAISESGEIFWGQGLRIGEQFKVTPRSKYLLKWSWKNL